MFFRELYTKRHENILKCEKLVLNLCNKRKSNGIHIQDAYSTTRFF